MIVRNMRIEHSETLSDFPSLWIETRVDGVHRFDTFFEVIGQEWYRCAAGDGPVLIRGKYPSNKTAEEFVEGKLKRRWPPGGYSNAAGAAAMERARVGC